MIDITTGKRMAMMKKNLMVLVVASLAFTAVFVSSPFSLQVFAENQVKGNANQAVSEPVKSVRKAAANRNYAIIPYTKITPAVRDWIIDKFKYNIGRSQLSSPDVKTFNYFDIFGPSGIEGYMQLKDFAVRNGFVFDKILLHLRNNLTTNTSPAWETLDKFDAFEQKNGVLQTKDDKTFNDVTSYAYNNTVLLSGITYVGYEEPFADINVTFSKFGKGVKGYWEYWNGARWTGLIVKDGSGNFSVNGLITFIPPADWEATSINNSRRKYFVRLRMISAKEYPATASIRGDDWLNGAKYGRGWDNTSPTIIRSGRIAYNPTPPADASAKFPYQAYASFWGTNHFIANPADRQVSAIDGKTYRTWAKFAAERMVDICTSQECGGIMCDDGAAAPESFGIRTEQTDLENGSAKRWKEESDAKYRDIVDYAHAANPSLKIGINARERDLVQKGDWNLYECFDSTWDTGSSRCMKHADGSTLAMCYDDYSPENNPKGFLGILIYADTVDLVPGTSIVWDRSNRGPLSGLSKHYIGISENTVFAYHSRGGGIYSETDEVYLYNDVVRHMSVDKIPKIEQVVRWGTYFPAMGIDIGKPDPLGHNKGKRDLQWKSGKSIGGGPDIWRRDFTRAIVLHRPAYYNTKREYYENYSIDIPLGGEFYPLRADGRTGPAITKIALRAAEGAILMKQPIKQEQD